MKLIDQAVADGLLTPEQAAEFRQGTIGRFDWGVLQTGHDTDCRSLVEQREDACTCEPWAVFMAAPGTRGAGVQWWWLGECWKPRNLMTEDDIAKMAAAVLAEVFPWSLVAKQA